MTIASPNVLVEPSDYFFRNIGDMAMLLTAIERLADLLPGATLRVLTDEPEELRALCPSATPMLSTGRRLWLGKHRLPASIRNLIPAAISTRLRESVPAAVLDGVRRLAFVDPRARERRADFVRTVRQADLLLVCGMGGITDFFPEYASELLDTMELAIRSGRRVAMVGQGIGPLADPQLRSRAAAILPRVDLIALRERRAGEPLLRALGVDPAKVIVTGDDAVQMAFEARGETAGDGIGVNLRVSDYAALDIGMAAQVGRMIAKTAEQLSAPLVALPVSRVSGEADLDTFRAMIPDAQDELKRAADICWPSDLIAQTQRCRIVVAGSYHAGVFALASGIPTIGIAASDYYEDKFRGLADMFGTGCEVISLREPDGPERVRSAMLRLWQIAPDVRAALLKSAEGQIAAGRAAYGKVAQLALEGPAEGGGRE